MWYYSYESMLLHTLEEINKAIAEGDKQHLDILLERMEKQIRNKFEGYG